LVFATNRRSDQDGPRFQELFLAIPRALKGPPVHLARGLKRLPPVGSLPTPQETRTLFALLRYRRYKRSGGSPSAGHSPVLKDYSWDDFLDFVAARKKKPRCPPEIQSFAEIEPSSAYDFYDDPRHEAWKAVYHHRLANGTTPMTEYELREAQILFVMSPMTFTGGEFSFNGRAVEHSDEVDRLFKKNVSSGSRLWRAACVGDRIVAKTVADGMGDAGLSNLVEERASHCRQERLRRIHAEIYREGCLTPRTLVAFDDLGIKYSAVHLGKALSPDHCAVRTALKIAAYPAFRGGLRYPPRDAETCRFWSHSG
jgi:hypothetical protein